MHIISASHIQKKVTRALEILSVYPTPPNEKPRIVKLHAKAGVASKMISVAEIAKREIAREGGKWFQYNKVESVMVEQKEKVKNGKGNGKEGAGSKEEGREKGKEKNGKAEDGEESEEDSTTFETMKTPWERANEGKPKMRAVPVMTVFLSRVRIEGLRKVYG
jgi:hypothetical protein